jgi:hypothetical protein
MQFISFDLHDTSSVSQYRSLMISLLAEPESDHDTQINGS